MHIISCIGLRSCRFRALSIACARRANFEGFVRSSCCWAEITILFPCAPITFREIARILVFRWELKAFWRAHRSWASFLWQNAVSFSAGCLVPAGNGRLECDPSSERLLLAAKILITHNCGSTLPWQFSWYGSWPWVLPPCRQADDTMILRSFALSWLRLLLFEWLSWHSVQLFIRWRPFLPYEWRNLSLITLSSYTSCRPSAWALFWGWRTLL